MRATFLSRYANYTLLISLRQYCVWKIFKVERQKAKYLFASILFQRAYARDIRWFGIPQITKRYFFATDPPETVIRQRRLPSSIILICNDTFSNVSRPGDASSYPWSADHLQGHRVAFNFPDVAIDLVGGKTYILTLLLVRHVRQDQSLPRSAFQRHAAVREYLRPSAHTRDRRNL